MTIECPQSVHSIVCIVAERVMEVKKDWLSGVLKVLLCFSAVYLWVMALVYVKKSYCGI